uniref:Zinc finger BED domain-containing protein RICESLEEPER 2 n=1 Tax=Tanacetum cinerariifolium TaxID=118510 RepID=A0A6L2MUH7_TANCI|nr:zinc finger BED domain-containing protein RICESLEEPER 2 [Tanacetum cinerariifolium]
MASESPSPSTATGVGSTNAPTIREIISTNRNPQIWKDFNLCIMTDNSKKTQCKHCFHFLLQCSNMTLRNHITSRRVLSIRRTRLTPASLDMCMCLKDLDAKERKQDKCPFETPLDFEEDVFDEEVQRNKVIPLSDEEIALDANASSEGTLSPEGPRYDYMMSSEAEDDY